MGIRTKIFSNSFFFRLEFCNLDEGGWQSFAIMFHLECRTSGKIGSFLQISSKKAGSTKQRKKMMTGKFFMGFSLVFLVTKI